MPDWFWALVVFVYGAVVGSFLNVCIWRLPRDESVAQPPSHCPHCGKTLAVADLVPLASQALLRARLPSREGLAFTGWAGTFQR